MRCFFIGHHDAPEQIYPELYQSVLEHIEAYHVDEFVVGQYGSFDRMAAHAVLECKHIFPDVRLIILLPYHPSERAIHAPEGYDEAIYPPGMENVPKRLAIVKANQYMILHSDYVIAYLRHIGSNVAGLCTYAKQHHIYVFRL